MRKIKEVFRLAFFGQRAIARACSISQSTVHEYLKRAEAAKVPWPLPEGWDEERVEKSTLWRAPIHRAVSRTCPS